MHKKLMTACLALFALAAFALPAAVQAAQNPVITHPTGMVLATGTKILAHNTTGSTMNVTPDAGVQLSCTTVSMTGELTNNTTGANITGNISAASFTSGGGPCTGFVNVTVDPLGLGTGAGQGWCLKAGTAMEKDEFQVLGGKCSEAAKKIEFKLTPSVGGECVYQSTTTTAAKGTFKTDESSDGETSDAILSIPRNGHTPTEDAGFTKTKDTSPFMLCPSSSGLRMSLTLETDNPPNTEPLYIST